MSGHAIGFGGVFCLCLLFRALKMLQRWRSSASIR